MSDIVERLRSAAKWGTMTSEFDASDRIEWMAADEIERLQAANESLSRALNNLTASPPFDEIERLRHDLARAMENHTADLTQRDALRAELAELEATHDSVCKELCRTDARLAEAEALLRWVKQNLDEKWLDEVDDRIDAFLGSAP